MSAGWNSEDAVPKGKRPPLRGDELPSIVVPPPGPRSRAATARLRRVEGAAIWGAEAAPIVWSRARGSVVEDLDGNRYLDLTSGFGAASLGHAPPEVARAVASQARRLMQGLGDLHPHEAREKLARRLASLGGTLASVLLAGTGSEAVELALKTAALVTGRRRVVAFDGGYHGQSGAALEVTAFPASPELLKPAGPPRAIHIPFPDRSRCAVRRPCASCDLACFERGWEAVERELRSSDPPGAVIVEPIQGRAGVIIPPPEFLPRLCAKARAGGMLVIADEILTGAGRTGPFWAWERSGPGAEPDLMTAGKGLGGGVAIGVLFGRPELMEIWTRHIADSGEAPYASTFYAHPLACAGALAALKRLASEEVRESRALVARRLESWLGTAPFHDRTLVRVAGTMAALETGPPRESAPSVPIARALLGRGLLALPGGLAGNVITILPAYTIAEAQLRHATALVEAAWTELRDGG